MQKKQILIVSIALFLLFFSAYPYRNYLNDDLFISLQFARNLSEVGEFSFNRGEPVYGFTSPLWIFLLATGQKFHPDLLQVARFLSTTFGLATVAVFFFLTRKIIRNEWIAFITTLILAYDPWFVRWVPSGMEAPLTIFLISLGLFIYLNKALIYWVSFIFALATLARPESALLIPIMLLDSWVNHKREKKEIVRAAVLFGLLLLPWILYSKIALGSLFPTTFEAKHDFLTEFSSTVVSFFIGAKIIGSTYIVQILLILWLFIRFWKEIVNEHLLTFGWVMCLPLFYLSGGTVLISRYLILIIPFLLLFAGLSIARFLNTPIRSRYFQKMALIIILFLIFLNNSIIGWIVNYPYIKNSSAVFNNSFIYIGKWFQENTHPHSTILIRDVGAVGFFSHRKIYDCIGLITPSFIPLWKKYGDHNILKNVLYAKMVRPDYVVDAAQSPNILVQESLYQGLYKPLFSRKFRGRGQMDKTLYYTVYQMDWSRYNSF
jgi:hypothetical protein